MSRQLSCIWTLPRPRWTGELPGVAREVDAGWCSGGEEATFLRASSCATTSALVLLQNLLAAMAVLVVWPEPVNPAPLSDVPSEADSSAHVFTAEIFGQAGCPHRRGRLVGLAAVLVGPAFPGSGWTGKTVVSMPLPAEG